MLWGLLLIQLGVAAVPSATVRCAPSCVTADQLKAALKERGLSRALTLELICKPTRAQLNLKDTAGHESHRAFGLTSADCADLPATVALLAEEWGASLRLPAASRVPPKPKVTSAPVQSAPSPAEAPSAPPTEKTAEPPALKVEAAPPSPVLVAPAPRPATKETRENVAFWAAGMWGSSPSVLQAGLQGEYALKPRLGFSLAGAFSAASTAPAAQGEVSSQAVQLQAGAWLSLFDDTHWGPRLSAQLGAEHVTATARGLDENTPATGWGPLFGAGVEWHHPIAAGVFARARLEGVLRPEPWVVKVAPLGEVARWPVVSARFTLGLGWQSNLWGI